MEIFRWRIVRVDDQLVRVMQYYDPDGHWSDFQPGDRPVPAARPAGVPPGADAKIIDLEQYRSRRYR